MQWITYKKESDLSVVYMLFYMFLIIQVALTLFKRLSGDNFYLVYWIFLIIEFVMFLPLAIFKKDNKVITIVGNKTHNEILNWIFKLDTLFGIIKDIFSKK